MRSPRSDENEVSLSQYKPDFVDGSVFRDYFEVTQECRKSIADAGFMADLIRSNVMRDLAVVSGDVNGLVVFPDNRLVFLCVL